MSVDDGVMFADLHRCPISFDFVLHRVAKNLFIFQSLESWTWYGDYDWVEDANPFPISLVCF